MLPGAGLFPPFLLAVIANSDNIGVKQSALVEVELIAPPCLKVGFLVPLTPPQSSPLRGGDFRPSPKGEGRPPLASLALSGGGEVLIFSERENTKTHPLSSPLGEGKREVN